MSSARNFFPGQLEITANLLQMLRKSVSRAFRIPFKQLPLITFHALILSVIVAGFWLLDSLKDPVLARIIGIEYQPVAKVISVLSTLVVTCSYDFLTSRLKRTDLFHVVSFFFGISFMVISALLADPELGLGNRDEVGPHRLLGWIAYVLIEAYGSLMVALFWSFTNSIMDLEEAKGAYGLIIAIAQLGAITGSTLATHARTIGIPQLFLFGALNVFSVSLLIKVYRICFRHSVDIEFGIYDAVAYEKVATTDAGAAGAGAVSPQLAAPVPEGRSVLAGFSEGFMLLLRNKYMLMVFGVSCLYEIVVTILDYQFKILAVHANSTKPDVILSDGRAVGAGVYEDQFANLLGHFGQATNLFSFLVSFFGFSFLVHRIGVRFSLMIFPTVLFGAVVVTNLLPSLSVLFVCVSVIKALVFSLHDPVKELLYIPTSIHMKFKAKAWIDVFGSRLAKAVGSAVSYLSYGDAKTLRAIAEVPCLLISLGVLSLAYLVGTEFEKLVENQPLARAEEKEGLRV